MEREKRKTFLVCFAKPPTSPFIIPKSLFYSPTLPPLCSLEHQMAKTQIRGGGGGTDAETSVTTAKKAKYDMENRVFHK